MSKKQKALEKVWEDDTHIKTAKLIIWPIEGKCYLKK